MRETLNQMISRLVNSASDEGCTDGLMVVDGSYVNKLAKWIEKENKAEAERQAKISLDNERESIAQTYFEEKDLGVICTESNRGWDGDDDTFIKTFWYDDYKGAGKMGKFRVEFKKGTNKVIDTEIYL